jgi:hypothetical protein
MDEWRADALQRQHARLKANAEARVRERREIEERRRSNAAVFDAQVDDRIDVAVQAAIAQEREQLIKLFAMTIAGLRAELDDAIRQLRDELQGSSRGKGHIVELPNPLTRRAS